MAVLTRILQYPIKSCKPIETTTAHVDERGLDLDRKFMLVDSSGNYLSQRARKMERMALIEAIIGVPTEHQPQCFLLTAGKETCAIPMFPEVTRSGKLSLIQANIRGSHCLGFELNPGVSEKLGNFLNQDVRLIATTDRCTRRMKLNESGRQPPIGFLDGAHVLMISEESLLELNGKLIEKDEEQLPMNRFRPNFVISGAEEGEEDRWKIVKIGEVIFFGTHRCERCLITSVNQETGARMRGGEPLRTLGEYKPGTNAPTFGMNFIALNDGVVRAGDKVQVIKEWKKIPPSTLG